MPPSRTPKATHVLYAVKRRGPGPVFSPPSQPMAPNTRVASTLVPASPRRRRRLLRNRRGRLHGRGGGGPPAAPKGHVRALPKPLGPHRLARCRRRSEALVRPAVTAAPYPGRGELVLAHTRRAARAGRRVKQKARTQADSKTPRTGRTSVRTEKWMTRTVDRGVSFRSGSKSAPAPVSAYGQPLWATKKQSETREVKHASERTQYHCTTQRVHENPAGSA